MTLRLEPGASFFFSFVIKKFVAVAKAKALAPARDARFRLFALIEKRLIAASRDGSWEREKRKKCRGLAAIAL